MMIDAGCAPFKGFGRFLRTLRCLQARFAPWRIGGRLLVDLALIRGRAINRVAAERVLRCVKRGQ